MKSLFLGLFLGLATVASAQETATERRLSFTFREASIEAVLKSLSQMTGWIFVLEASPRGTITAISDVEVPVSRCLDFLNASLKQHGLVVLNPSAPRAPGSGETLRVLEIARAVREPSRVYVGLDPREIPATDEPRTQILPLKSASAADAAKDFGEVFRRLLGDGGQVATSAFSNSILISGPSGRVRSVAEILSVIDQTTSAHSRVVVIPLRYVDAVQAAKTLGDVFKPDNVRADAGQQPRLPGILRALRTGAESDQPAPVAVGSTRITPEPRTNSLIVGATEDNLALAKGLIEEIDRPSAALNVYVVPLTTDAASTAALLNSLWNAPGNSNASAVPKSAGQVRTDGTLAPGQTPFRETTSPPRAGGATPRR